MVLGHATKHLDYGDAFRRSFRCGGVINMYGCNWAGRKLRSELALAGWHCKIGMGVSEIRGEWTFAARTIAKLQSALALAGWPCNIGMGDLQLQRELGFTQWTCIGIGRLVV